MYLREMTDRLAQKGTRALLRRSFVYALGRQLIRWKLWKSPYRATSQMLYYALEQVQYAFCSGKTSACSSILSCKPRLAITPAATSGEKGVIPRA